MVPRTARGRGAPRSSTATMKALPSQCAALGPIINVADERAIDDAPRSVIAQPRAPRGPYRATLSAQKFSGSPRPRARAHA